MRGYITGVTKTSLWPGYAAGARNIAGNPLPNGLRKNERLAVPILTPTTKFEARDRNLGRDEAIAAGLVTAELFDRCADVCFRLFARGTELAARRGLILADTKYELGLLGDEIVLIDEVRIATAIRYILLAEELTQQPFTDPELTAAERVASVLVAEPGQQRPLAGHVAYRRL